GAVRVHRVPVRRDLGAGPHQVVPRHAAPLRRHLDHRDAVLHRTHQAAQVAAHAVLLAHLRLRLRPLRTHPGVEAGPHARVGRGIDPRPVHRQVYALVCALVTGDVTQVALDALVLVDAGDRLERQVEVAEVGDAVRGGPDDLLDAAGTLGVEPVRQPVGQVLDEPEAVVHHGCAYLDGRGAQQQELGGVAPGLHAAHARDGHTGSLHLVVDRHLREHVQRDGLDGRPGVAAVAALAADVRAQLERVEVDAD